MASLGPWTRWWARRCSGLQLRQNITTNAAKGDTAPPPLTGLRVVDLTRVLAGPFASMILGDLGADVIKIENPKGGDDTRHWGPPFVSGESAYYLCVNRNKRSIGVNLKSPAGVQIIKDLVKNSDVLMENYIPGKLEEMGLGYEQLREVNPKLVYCSITGFGSDGPLADKPGYDVIVQGMYGLMSITGPEDGPPVKTGVALTDIATGLFAHGAILAALHGRSATGVGQKIDCSLMETQLACLANIGQNWLLGAVDEARRWGSAHESIVPYQAFECKDGMYMVGAGNDRQFVKLAAAIGMPELSSDPRFLTNRDRTKNRRALLDILQAHFRTMTRKELGDTLEGIGGLPCGPLRNVGEAYKDEQALHRGMVQKVQHPKAGELPLAGIPVKYSHTKPSIRMAPPLLGQHTDEVLQSVLSYSSEKIEQLRKERVVA